VGKFDRVFWKGLWSLVRPYWTSEKRARALGLLAIVAALSLGTTGMRAVFSYVSRDVMNSLQAKDAANFYHLMLLYVVWILIFVPIAAFHPYLTGLLGIEWRESFWQLAHEGSWMTPFRLAWLRPARPGLSHKWHLWRRPVVGFQARLRDVFQRGRKGGGFR
jgi:ABC-type uncharacterized transport system fused permease/ATPase subunit